MIIKKKKDGYINERKSHQRERNIINEVIRSQGKHGFVGPKVSLFDGSRVHSSLLSDFNRISTFSIPTTSENNMEKK